LDQEVAMTPHQALSSGRLGGRAAGGIVSQVQHLHHTISRRPLRAVGSIAAPVEVVHDGIASAVYGIVRSSLAVSGVAAGAVAAGAMTGRRSDLRATPVGNHLISALNAVIGDALARDGDPLATSMSVRVDGHDVDATRHDLAAAFPDATPRMAVFVHGLGENERSWLRRSSAPDTGGTYGSRLAADFGYTPVYLAYNSGRHISDSGRELSRLLQRLHREWPAAIDEMLLVGHSMGGLVIRSACHYGADEPWVEDLRHVVYLGSPHTGAPLARGVRVLAWALDKAPVTRPLAVAADHSPGVRDLRHGYVVDDDWSECDAGVCFDDHRTDVPLLATANHCVVSAAVVSRPRSTTARLVGDLLVQPSSAHGRRRQRQPIQFQPEHRHHLGRLTHFDLLNHPAVYDALREWLVADSPGA
jgi:pimeloyl-ACP methyl ester carboxylesterase